MTRPTALVLAISLLLLGGAWLLSRALTSDVPVPAVALTPGPPERTFEPGVAPPPLPPVLAREAVTSPPPEPEPLRAAPPTPPPPETPSPEQVELDGLVAQGLLQLKDEQGGPANWRRAEKLFIRCLTLSPEDERCREGVHQARLRLGPRLQRPPGVPLVPVQDPPPAEPEE